MEAGDFDIGEQFHNYTLHPSEQQYCGVDLPADLVEEMTAKGFVAERCMRWAQLVYGNLPRILRFACTSEALNSQKGSPEIF
jgi:hypothetical protein